MPGKNENGPSKAGMSRAKGSGGSETVKSIDHVGASSAGGMRFKLPAGVPDKSCVKRDLKE